MGCEQHGAAERCELCGAPAAVHCAADAAFLCAACDANVHGANFLASRHRRTRLFLAADDGYESSATASSSCVSTADSASSGAATSRPAVNRRRPRAEAVLEGWAKRMGIPAGLARRRSAAAARAVARACGARVPLRVAMAAALWREVSAAGGGGGQGDALRRLEACAHVPARIVVAVAASMARARARSAAEGWDECSWAGPKSNPTARS
ncbi:hypothetical protein PR202_gb28112 [Eleusine coracana subsp. coracana]|uniref:B box-type domain-containing protein n=1 Tax=Eleusine coracana subsp. coracana TaxID=191504 RepID=A0AAV5FWF3_ELECO|nr:hypothetical protein QOZ80_6AG0547190 [Eleusine coracana subsp. coracana]GJN39020.1 hypothetical protein PR202_gb28112 [Eleusine coracana subsp. coracana]